MMDHEMEVDKRCLSEYIKKKQRNHRFFVRSSMTTLEVLMILLLSIISGSIPMIVSLLGVNNNSVMIDQVTAAWMNPSTMPSTKQQRIVSYSNHNKYIAYGEKERQRLLVLCSTTPITTLFNIDDRNNGDIPVPTSPSTLLFLPSSSCKVDQMSGTDLAYIGDVVYELFIRTRTVWPLKRTTDLQQQVVALVRGKLLNKNSIILVWELSMYMYLQWIPYVSLSIAFQLYTSGTSIEIVTSIATGHIVVSFNYQRRTSFEAGTKCGCKSD